MIDGTERFIATAIRFVRIEPLAPTIVPATINAKLSNAIPAAAAERPVNAFSSEITTGMSAPPIGNTTMFPKIAAATRIPKMKRAWLWVPAAIAIAEPTQISNRIRFSACWAGTLIGRPGRISCNFPNAMLLPQNDTEPMIAANSEATITFISQDPVEPVNSPTKLAPRDQRDRATTDPVEQGHHLRHRRHLHATRRRHTHRRANRHTERHQQRRLNVRNHTRLQQGGDDGDRHANRRDLVPPHRRLRTSQPAQTRR